MSTNEVCRLFEEKEKRKNLHWKDVMVIPDEEGGKEGC